MSRLKLAIIGVLFFGILGILFTILAIVFHCQRPLRELWEVVLIAFIPTELGLVTFVKALIDL